MKTLIRLIILILVFSIFSISADALNAFSHSVIFDEHKSTLNTHERLTFRKYLDSVYHTNAVVRIEVLGYCNDGEYQDFFLNLSKKRSAYITKELKSYFKNQPLKNIHFCVSPLADTTTYNSVNTLIEKSRRIDIVFSINTNTHRNIHKGDKFILNGILFEGGTDLLLDESMPTLKTLHQELVKHPQLVIQIQGHIYDTAFNLSEEKRNETLSARRAKRIYDYLIFKGINPKRLSYIGLENQFPLHKGAKYDRRVEIEIINI